MKLRVSDRILVFLAGILLLAGCAGLVSQLFFDVDLVGMAGKAFTSDSPRIRIALIALAVVLLLIGGYCVRVLFRHRKRKDRFVLQKNEGGELAISLKALENMVQKCLDQHEEIRTEKLRLENRKDGLLIRIAGSVAGGISIPLTIEALQKQIRQYVTACSGVDIKGIQVQIESSGEDAPDAPFAIAAPASRPLLRDAEEKQTSVQKDAVPMPAPEKEEVTAAAPASAEPAEIAEKPTEEAIPEADDDDRPLHQRLFSPRQEKCIVPEPPEEREPDQADTSAPETDEQDGKPEENPDAETEPAGTDSAAAAGEKNESAEPDPNYLESLKAFDDAITGGTKEVSDA